MAAGKRGRPAKTAAAKAEDLGVQREEIENMDTEQLKDLQKAKKAEKAAAEAAEKKRKRAARLKAQEAAAKRFAAHREKAAKMTSLEKEAYKAHVKEKGAATRKKLQGDLIFPVRKMKGQLNLAMGNKRRFKTKQSDARKVTTPCAVFMTAVVEYLTAEVLELSGEVAKSMKKQRIVPRHILAAIRMDEELNNFLPRSTMITSAGVMPKPVPAFLKHNNVPRKEWNLGPNDIFQPQHLYDASKAKKDNASQLGEINNNK